jgi:hypothetical protein
MKKTITIIISAVMVLTMALSAAPTTAFAASTTAVAASSLTKSGTTKSSYSVKVGKTKTLKAKVKFKKNAYSVAAVAKSFKVTTSAEGKIAITDITFKRSSDKVWTAYVKVKAAKAGKSTITVKTTKGSKKSVKWTVTGKKKATSGPAKPAEQTVALQDVTISNDAPIVGDKISVALYPSNATIKSYQWRADCQAISGATGSSYTATKSDVGKKIDVIVVDKNSNTIASFQTSKVQSASDSGSSEPTKPATTVSVNTVRARLYQVRDMLIAEGVNYYSSGCDIFSKRISQQACGQWATTLHNLCFPSNCNVTAYTGADAANYASTNLRPGDVYQYANHIVTVVDMQYDVTIPDGMPHAGETANMLVTTDTGVGAPYIFSTCYFTGKPGTSGIQVLAGPGGRLLCNENAYINGYVDRIVTYY